MTAKKKTLEIITLFFFQPANEVETIMEDPTVRTTTLLTHIFGSPN